MKIALHNVRLGVRFLLFVGACTLSFAAASENRVRTALISDASSVVRGESFRVGVRFQLPERAHIYWKNPGDSGLATGIKWQLPHGVEISELQWPNPKQFKVDGLDDISFGYESEVLLFASIAVDKAFEDETLVIAARPYWLICLDDGVCIPEDANLELALPIAENMQPSEQRNQFEASAARVPVDFIALSKKEPIDWLGVSCAGTEVTAHIGDPWEIVTVNPPEEAAFFPHEGPAWKRLEPLIEDGFMTLTFEPQETDPKPPRGVLTLPVRRKDGTESRTFYIEVKDAE